MGEAENAEPHLRRGSAVQLQASSLPRNHQCPGLGEVTIQRPLEEDTPGEIPRLPGDCTAARALLLIDQSLRPLISDLVDPDYFGIGSNCIADHSLVTNQVGEVLMESVVTN